jgi:trimeric autotransporter adhesin
MRRMNTAALAGLLAIAVTAPAAVAKEKTGDQLVAASQDRPGELVAFNSDRPNKASVLALTGPAATEPLVGLDTRPANGRLYGVGASGRLYLIDPDLGAGTAASTAAAQISSPLVGAAFGSDFNPVPDRLRLNSDAQQNLRINVDTGAAINDGALAYAAGDENAGADPDVAGAAYTNADNDPATGTMLFDVDARQDVLALQSPPNDGVLLTVGDLGVDTTRFVGFDITPPGAGATPYAVLDPKGHGSRLYVIDLATGKARQVGQVGNGSRFHLDSLATLTR